MASVKELFRWHMGLKADIAEMAESLEVENPDELVRQLRDDGYPIRDDDPDYGTMATTQDTETDGQNDEHPLATEKNSLKSVDNLNEIYADLETRDDYPYDEVPSKELLKRLLHYWGLKKIHAAGILEEKSSAISTYTEAYGLKRAWNDPDAIQRAIDNGDTVHELAERWVISESTLRKAIDKYDIRTMSLMVAYSEIIEAGDVILEQTDNPELEEQLRQVITTVKAERGMESSEIGQKTVVEAEAE